MITIVMPVYNTGVYLKESIESILNQTYGDFELICVDDCSKDDLTLEILDAYEQVDERISVVHFSENAGAAEARNMGLKHAKGEYIIFLDADDIFDEDMLEKMYNSLESTNADMCVCGHRTYSEQSKSIVNEYKLRNITGITNRMFSIKELGEEGLLFWYPVPWNKMCKTDFVRRNGLCFQNLSSSNDVFYALMACLTATGIVYCNEGVPLLTYRTNTSNQISANRTSINGWYATEKVLAARSSYEDEVEWNQIICNLVVRIVHELRRSSDEEKRKECYEVVRLFLQENKKKINIHNRRFCTYVSYLVENEYETKWFEKVDDFDRQIEDSDDAIKAELASASKRIVVWGNGKRGQAFQRYCKKNGIKNVVVVDQKNDLIGTYTEEGFEMVHTNEAWKNADIVVASNYDIYMELIARTDMKSLHVIDLEKYCPV